MSLYSRIRARVIRFLFRQSAACLFPKMGRTGRLSAADINALLAALNAQGGTVVVADPSGRHNQRNDGWQPPAPRQKRCYGQPSRCSRRPRR
ncbi:hypothetical protein [Klebsiella aerogenes]|uniref:hypothetical protein n=1 Tax=Klebsiella aerogenes TaxID=548 RepID=UPI000DA10AD7|nr:hypothetical protein [Klebsiella aerogenes]HCB2859827.1 hypothetical protein [Klebsiella aerogenes]HCB2864830.1 hypothetical protein [Klebsiella aerogenes]HCB2880498.1 hypothetical protein [Klebsiella aerogenes]HCB3345893.1 hypothetical protein [Klebsiella aerogenes]HCM1811895.1 hypothetical protein [Klebsiella aerogenes]